MRKRSMICAGAALLAIVSPANAQYFTPFGGPGMLTTPEAASGAIGAGAAHSVAQQQRCQQMVVGRDGPRTLCLPGSSAPAPHR